MKLNVIYEDNHIIVVEKPVNVSVQKDISDDEDLLTMVKEYVKVKYNKPGNVFIGLVHRLDRPVGGIMVFARTSKAASRLSEQIRNKSVKKEYLAVVRGKLEKERGVLEDYLVHDKRSNITSVVSEREAKNNKEAKKAILEYEVLAFDEKNDISLVKIDLKTGRHHQIRVQFDNIGHGLIGDYKYGENSRGETSPALFAYKIKFLHPTKNEEMCFEIKPRDEGVWKNFTNLIKTL